MKPAFESLETRNLLSTLGLATTDGDRAVLGDLGTRIAPVADISTDLLIVRAKTRPPRVTVTLSNGILSITGTPGDDVIRVSNLNPTTVRVAVGVGLALPTNYDFPTTSVNRIVIQGWDGNDSLVNLTAIDSVVDGGNGNDFLQSGGGNDVLLGRGGNDILTDTGVGSTNTLDGGDGQDNIWGFGNDTIFGGGGDDTIYSIVGTSFLDGGAGNDRVITNGVSTNVADVADRPAVVFKTRATPVALDNGVLYFAGDATDNLVALNQVGNKIVVTYRDASGTSTQTFNASQVTQIAGILGAGNDTVINNTNTDGVFYGFAGNDVLIGGGGNDLLKGGGDNDVLIGGGGNDDLTGDLGTDYIEGGAGIDTLRAGFDQTDTLVADAFDIVLGDPLTLLWVSTQDPAPIPTPIPTSIRKRIPLELSNLTYDATLPLI
jgi:Ca2+-binding RTX toxin-like protein